MATDPNNKLDVNAVMGQMGSLLKNAETQFVAGNSDLLAQLGDDFGPDLLNAIFGSSWMDELPTIDSDAVDAPDLDVAGIAAIAKIVADRDQQVALITAAELKDAQI